jgi:hypothetical protein
LNSITAEGATRMSDFLEYTPATVEDIDEIDEIIEEELG